MSTAAPPAEGASAQPPVATPEATTPTGAQPTPAIPVMEPEQEAKEKQDKRAETVKQATGESAETADPKGAAAAAPKAEISDRVKKYVFLSIALGFFRFINLLRYVFFSVRSAFIVFSCIRVFHIYVQSSEILMALFKEISVM